MKTLSRLVYDTVMRTRSEEFFVALRRRVNFIRRFIPLSVRHKFPSIGKVIPASASYPANDRYLLERDNTRFQINRSDYVQWRLFYGVRDNALKEAKKFLKHDCLILDIGSSFGAFSLKLAAYAREQKIQNVRIHAFEPNPVVAENFDSNLSMNKGLENIVTLHRFGLGSRSAREPFTFSESNTGAGRIVNKSSGKIDITIKRLDDFTSEIKPSKIAFIKLIAEGYEPLIFEGGWKTISRYRPPIFFEVTPSWWQENDASVSDVLDKLSALGYHFRIEHFNELVPFEPEKFSSRTQFNLMAIVPDNKKEQSE